MTTTLQVEDLQVAFATDGGSLTAVDGISFGLKAGQTLGLVGESGCGKSVTALSLLGLIPPPGNITGGRITYEDDDLLKLAEPELTAIRGKRIGMIFQEPMTALNPVFSVGAQVAEALWLHEPMSKADARIQAVQMLERVGIADAAARADSYPHQLSGGMRQRVMIAMALICKPDILIADEPTTALDVTVQAQILDLILEMQAELGLAVLFISHDLGVVSEIADEVMVMYAGRVVEQASAAELFATPNHPYTQGLIATLPQSQNKNKRLPAIPGQVPDLRDMPQGCAFAPRCPIAEDRCRVETPPLVGGTACWKVGL
ncbi:MAG: ABC transporter ATP-binding protein [Rhodospirillaceae bacterium]|nr:ABC transporter ATP-binding protein [Rhodospirillaceae bacterium]